MKKGPYISRRRFVKNSCCGAMSSIPVLSMLLNLKLANNAAATQISSFNPSGDYKTLVCAFMEGGNDSFNMLVPTDNERYGIYQTSRSNLALQREFLLPLDQLPDGDGLEYGLHPNAHGLQELFNGLGGDPGKRRLSFIANIGTLVEPTTLAQFKDSNSGVRLPKGLGSHLDQQVQWQTSVPQGLPNLSGWGGRIADILNSQYNAEKIGMNMSLFGNNVFQSGNNYTQYAVFEKGGVVLSANTNQGDPTFLKNVAFKSILEQEYHNLVRSSFSEVVTESLEQSEFLTSEFNNFDDSTISGQFPSTPLGAQFKLAVKVIALRERLGLRRQTLFLNGGDFDTHLDLLGVQAKNMTDWGESMRAFQNSLEDLGLQDSVVTFVASDFGRTLRSNGRGTDHAWGGNTMVMGGPVEGGRIFGTYPNLTLDGPDDIGAGGRILPTTSVDVMFAELAMWFGVSNGDLPTIFPNLGNFYSIGSGNPLGILSL
ncbi:MAG: DUF1501 domain-containing protein [Puniceicoccaceae bacterium]